MLAKLLTLRQLAERAGTSPRALKRRLRKMFDRDGGDWWVRPGDAPGHPSPPRTPVLIDSERLALAHPEIFPPRGTEQAQLREHDERIKWLIHRVNRLGTRFRLLEARVPPLVVSTSPPDLE